SNLATASGKNDDVLEPMMLVRAGDTPRVFHLQPPSRMMQRCIFECRLKGCEEGDSGGRHRPGQAGTQGQTGLLLAVSTGRPPSNWRRPATNKLLPQRLGGVEAEQQPRPFGLSNKLVVVVIEVRHLNAGCEVVIEIEGVIAG